MASYITINTNGRIGHNSLWLRKYHFQKQSKMKYKNRYNNHRIKYWNIFSDHGIHSSY